LNRYFIRLNIIKSVYAHANIDNDEPRMYLLKSKIRMVS